MVYEYARIDLRKTNYDQMDSNSFKVLNEWDYGELNAIFKKYCSYKKFKSVMPMFYEDFKSNKVLGYFDNGKLIGWSVIILYPSQLSVTADQFAWDYETPKLRLGINSLKHECAYFKEQGYHYLYLHGPDEYKKHFDGFEIVGPLDA